MASPIKNHTVNHRYLPVNLVENVDYPHTLLIQSDINTGKTTFARDFIQLVRTQKKHGLHVLVITHRVLLVHNLAQRFSFTSYDELSSNDELRHSSQLVITPNSLHRLFSQYQDAPHYDIIVIDEVNQVFETLFGKTFHHGAGLLAFELLNYLIEQATHVLAMDAHIREVTIQWLANQLPEENPTMTHVVNSYRPDWGTLNFYFDQTALLEHAVKLIEKDNGPVVIACGSIKQARTLEQDYIARFGDDAVIAIHGENRQNTPHRAFVDSINEKIINYRAVIYSSTLGSGVDITTPVRAVFGLFHLEPLHADDIMQMLGRCRATQETGIYVPEVTTRNLETDVETLFQREINSFLKTQFAVKLTDKGRLEPDSRQSDFCRLHCEHLAEQNRSKNHLRHQVMGLANGRYRIQEISTRSNEQERDYYIEARTQLTEYEKQLILTLKDTLTPEQYREKAKAGIQTPETKAQLIRGNILTAFGSVSELTLADYENGAGIQKLKRHVDFLRYRSELTYLDQLDHKRGTVMHRRQHHFVYASVIHQALKRLWGNQLNTDRTFSNDEINQAMTAFMSQYRKDVIQYLGWEPGRHKDKNLPILRYILARIGLKLEKYKRGSHTGRFGLSIKHFMRWRSYAEQLHKAEKEKQKKFEEVSKICI